MVFSALKQCRPRMQGPLYIRSFASSSTDVAEKPKKNFYKTAAATPIYMIWGFVALAAGLAVHSVKQQVLHSPSVQVTKTKRGCIPEVDFPDTVIKSANKFENKSHLRKVGHIQERQYIDNTQEPFSRSRKCETLKTIGVPTRED